MEASNAHLQQHLPPTSRLYISEVTAHGVSVSGPPSTLRQFERNSASQGLRSSPLQIHAPYHAPHLYDERDLASLLPSSEDISNYSTRIPVLSTCNGKLRRPSNLPQAFHAALADIFINPIDLKLMYEGISFVTRLTEDSEILVHSIGTTVGNSLSRILSEKPKCPSSHEYPERIRLHRCHREVQLLPHHPQLVQRLWMASLRLRSWACLGDSLMQITWLNIGTC